MSLFGTIKTRERERLLDAADRAADRLDDFLEAYRELAQALDQSPERELREVAGRMAAYQPEFDPTTDVGMGRSAKEWLLDAKAAIVGREEVPS